MLCMFGLPILKNPVTIWASLDFSDLLWSGIIYQLQTADCRGHSQTNAYWNGKFTLTTPHFHTKTFHILYITRFDVYFVSEGVLCLFTCLRHTQFPGNWRARWWEQQSIIQGWHSCSRNLTSLMKTGRETKTSEKKRNRSWRWLQVKRTRREWKNSTAAHRWLPSPPQIQAGPKPGLDICGNKVIRGLVGNLLRGVIQQNDLT